MATRLIDLWKSNGFRAWVNFPASIRLKDKTSFKTFSIVVKDRTRPWTISFWSDWMCLNTFSPSRFWTARRAVLRGTRTSWKTVISDLSSGAGVDVRVAVPSDSILNSSTGKERRSVAEEGGHRKEILYNPQKGENVKHLL